MSDLELECTLTIEGDKAADDFEREGGKIVRRSQANVVHAVKALGLQFTESDDDNPFGEITASRPDGTRFSADDDEAVKKLWLEIERQFGFRPAWTFFRMVFTDYAERMAKAG
ncbi:MAG: hypothetical protein KIT48_04575 [Pseudolabrys sp.]|nr:hypothetical protein [Pseudolabrys sp.]